MNFLDGPDYAIALRKSDMRRSVNLYILRQGKPPTRVSVPGYALFADLGAEVRGTITTNDRAFFVAGSKLYEVFADRTPVVRGTLLTFTGPVELEFGVTQLTIVDGPNGYVLTLATNVFQVITSDGFYGSDRVTFQDNYFIFNRPGTGQMYITAINDATTLDALDFATAESNPDNLVAIISVQRRLLMIGQVTTEVWFNSGALDMPFEREGTTCEVGCVAAHSVRVVDNTAFMIGRDKNGSGIVYRLHGYDWVRCSEQGVEEALQGSTDLSAAVGYAYQDEGLTHYAINAPGLTSTWVYELANNAWHERCDLDELGQLKADRGVCHTFAFGEHLIGGSDGKVYRLDKTLATKDGEPIVCERIGPHQTTPALKAQFFPDGFRLNCTTGEAAPGIDPQVELSWLDGRSGSYWSNPVPRSIGKTGERFPFIHWPRVGGSTFERVWRVRYAGQTPLSLINAVVKVVEGT